MADGPTHAGLRLERLLHLLPAACRSGGVAITEMAAELGVERKTILDDLIEFEDRSFHLPPGSPDFTIALDGDRVRAWSPGHFKRPLRLTSREALALELALRAATGAPEFSPHGSQDALRRKLGRGLARAAATDPRPAEILAPELEEDLYDVRRLLAHAARECSPCAIAYAKPGEADLDRRTVHPYAVVYAEGEWYVLARCIRADAVRTFRASRIVEARVEAGSFEKPAGFHPGAYFPEGRALQIAGCIEALVRYSPEVARWIAETEPGQRELDGSYTVRRQVADPEWLVRHVLGHAGEAVVVDPPELRAIVADRARRLAPADPRSYSAITSE